MNEKIKTVATIVLTVTTLMFLLYFCFSLYYKAYFLMNPCEICSSLEGNEHLAECFTTASQVQINPATGEAVGNDNFIPFNNSG